MITIDVQQIKPVENLQDDPKTPNLVSAVVERKNSTIDELKNQIETFRQLLRVQDAADEDEQTCLIKELSVLLTDLQTLEQEQAIQLKHIHKELEHNKEMNILIKSELESASKTRMGMMVALAIEMICLTLWLRS